MINYTKRYVNVVSLIITIIIFLLFSKSNTLINKFDFTPHLISNMFKRSIVLVELNSNNINQETKEEKNNDYSDTKVKNNETKEKEKKETNWKIIIPKISLEAEICEGTSKKVMDEYIGHFEETSLKSGNVGLAAHNRGYEVNYFAEIKKLQIGDEIIYKYYDFEKTYKVSKNIIITDEDWSYLEETEENTITLITCIENQPEYRRCVQAIEKIGRASCRERV